MSKPSNFSSNVLAFFSSCIVLDEKEINKSKESLGSNPDWSSVIKRATRENIAPLLYNSIKHCHDILAFIPLKAELSLREEYLFTAAGNVIILKELESILDTLRGNHISAIVLKGAALLENFYKNIALRPMSDIDILVKPQELPDADICLKKIGYKPVNAYTGYPEASPSPYCNSVVYQKPSSIPFYLHLHWHLVNSSIPLDVYYHKINMERVWRLAQIMRIANREALVLCPHHFLIHLCEHAFKHGFEKLVHFYDVHRIIRHYSPSFDWQRLNDETLEFNLARQVYYTLYLSSLFFKTKIPQFVFDRLRPSKLSIGERKIVSTVTSGKHSFYFPLVSYLAMNEGILNKTRFIWRSIFIPKRVAEQLRPFGPHNSMFGYYLSRTLRGLAYAGGFKNKFDN